MLPPVAPPGDAAPPLAGAELGPAEPVVGEVDDVPEQADATRAIPASNAMLMRVARDGRSSFKPMTSTFLLLAPAIDSRSRLAPALRRHASDRRATNRATDRGVAFQGAWQP